jgi:hypothetical protein
MSEGVDSARAARRPIKPDSITTYRLGSWLLDPEASDLFLELDEPLLVLLPRLALGTLTATAYRQVTDPECGSVGKSEDAVLVAALQISQNVARHDFFLTKGFGIREPVQHTIQSRLRK